MRIRGSCWRPTSFCTCIWQSPMRVDASQRARAWSSIFHVCGSRTGSPSFGTPGIYKDLSLSMRTGRGHNTCFSELTFPPNPCWHSQAPIWRSQVPRFEHSAFWCATSSFDAKSAQAVPTGQRCSEQSAPVKCPQQLQRENTEHSPCPEHWFGHVA
jgi:hypothetical protein